MSRIARPAMRWQSLRWEGARLLRGLGLPGAAAAALSGVALAVWWGGVLPLKYEAEHLLAEHAWLERRASQAATAASAAPRGMREQLVEFKSRFGDEKSLSGSLARLHAAARRHGLQLEQAEFKLTSEAREPLSRYAIVLPVKAEYKVLRRFTQDALRELPGLALEEVNLRRSDARSPVLEAQLRFVLFVTKAA